MLEVFAIEIGLYATNSYLLLDPISGEAAVIDPAVFDSNYEKFLQENGVTELKYILLTHGHFDHICGAYPLKEKLGGEVMIHEEDAICLKSADMSLANSVKGYIQTVMDPDKTFKDGDTLFLGENKITVMHTPGHTRGSSLFITDEYIFSGDTLFRRGMGRTDLPGGSTKAIFKSLRAIGQMQGEYRIFPGHGTPTGLAYEKRNNRYLRADDTSHG